jgi:hypothetical protein
MRSRSPHFLKKSNRDDNKYHLDYELYCSVYARKKRKREMTGKEHGNGWLWLLQARPYIALHHTLAVMSNDDNGKIDSDMRTSTHHPVDSDMRMIGSGS